QDYISEQVTITDQLTEAKEDILFDPQTSGGLLISVAADKVDELVAKLEAQGVTSVAVIGQIEAGSAQIEVGE
ncbi:MAG: AIR synthase-related protein, partial [Bacillota bacterium]